MRHSASWIFLVLPTISPFAGAAPPEDGDLLDAATVFAVVRQLEADDAQQRSDAAARLQDWGSRALRHLPPPDRLETAAGRDALVKLRNALERRAAEESARAALVTLDQTAPLDVLAAELRKQTGNDVWSPTPAPQAALNMAWQRQPFWKAVEDLARISGTVVVADADRGGFSLRAPDPQSRAAAAVIDGAVRIEAAVSDLREGSSDAEHIARVMLTWQAEPRLRPLFLRVKTGEWSGRCGKSVVSPWNREAVYELPFGAGGRQVAWPLDLVWPAESAEAWSLAGKGVLHLAAGTEAIEFDEQALRPGTARRRGGVTVRLRSVDIHDLPAGRELKVRITIAYDTGGPAFESHRAWIFHQAAYLKNGEQRQRFADYDVTQAADGGFGVEYRFPAVTWAVHDIHFVYEAPTLLLDLPVKVAFRNLPTPGAMKTEPIP